MFTLIAGLVLVVIVAVFIRLAGVVRYIPNGQIGIVEKLWSKSGSLKSGLIALNGEAGWQPNILRGGFHFFKPYQFHVRKMPLVTITQGQIGYIFARDGAPLAAGQTLASNETATDFNDVRTFLKEGGQKGPQRRILREGTYALNLAQFVVLTSSGIFSLPLDSHEKELFEHMGNTLAERDGYSPVVIKDKDDLIGVVTVHDGQALPSGEIIAPEVGTNTGSPGFHSNFQDADAFVKNGFRGRQLQVVVDGTYYINRLFATIELIPKTTIEVGTVGVVVSYTGTPGKDVSDPSYRHGELVERGCRGVWAEPLMPGKYAFNTFAGVIRIVPTTNFILKWSADLITDHKLDANLREINLITKDAFEPSLPLSVVIHIDYRKAPLVVQRFGEIKKLVEQTLDPMVSSYFKNIGQTKTLIELLRERAVIQAQSSEEMREKFSGYSLELQEVLIGTPKSPAGNGQIENILVQLRDRQIAEEQVETFKLRERAATAERTYNEAQAVAAAQGDITRSLISVTVKKNEGAAEVAFATEKAQRIGIEAAAEANRLEAVGKGEAARVSQIGLAEADVTKAKVDASGGPNFQLSEQVFSKFCDAIKSGAIPIVPQIMMNGGGDNGSQGGGMADALLAIVTQNLASTTKPSNPVAANEPAPKKAA